MVKQIKQNIIVGVTGGIAAYKSAYLVRLLKQQGFEVRVVMTQSAKQFITSTTLQALAGYPVRDDLWDPAAENAMSHIELARWADKIVLAPASANSIAKISHGLADDLLTTLCLATPAPIFIAPAMNKIMWDQPVTKDNIVMLEKRGIHIIPPTDGEQACGDVGLGRMAEPEAIVQVLIANTQAQCLRGQRILITAGPTQEAIDPVRYISNRSSGKMGFALAKAAKLAGAEVTLISGPVALSPIPDVMQVNVVTANDMLAAVISRLDHHDIFISAAAVADFSCLTQFDHKAAKKELPKTLTLIENQDILAEVAKAKKLFTVGFCAQTHDVLAYAREKLIAKQCDMIAANDVSQPDQGFDSDYNEITLLWHDGAKHLARTTKAHMAIQLVELIAEHAALGEPCEESTS